MNYKIKKTAAVKGFTLVELIISIGIVAIISSSILQLFITAGNLNRKSHDIDKCVMLSETIIEQFKSSKLPGEVKNIDEMKNAFYTGNNRDFTLSLYFDNKWNIISKDLKPNVGEGLKAAAYVMKAEITNAAKDGLYSIKIRVIKNKFGYLEKATGKDFYSINAAKYFAAARVD